MPLMTALISMACTNAYPNQMDACQKAMEAGSKQVQLYQTDEKVENYFTVHAKETSENYLGQRITEGVAGTAYLYKIYKNKSVNLRLPTLGVCDSANTQLEIQKYTLNLKWNVW